MECVLYASLSSENICMPSNMGTRSSRVVMITTVMKYFAIDKLPAGDGKQQPQPHMTSHITLNVTHKEEKHPREARLKKHDAAEALCLKHRRILALLLTIPQFTESQAQKCPTI